MSEFYDKMTNAYNDSAQWQSNNQKDLIVTDLHLLHSSQVITMQGNVPSV